MTFRPTLAGCACLLTFCWPAVALWTGHTAAPAVAGAIVQDPIPGPSPRRDPALAAHLDGAMQSVVRHDYLTAGDQLLEATALVRARFEETVRAALPRASTSHVAIDPPPPATPQTEGVGGFDPLRAMTLGVDRPVEQRYRARDGRGTIRLLVIPRSPSVREALQDLAVAGQRDGVEAVEIGRHLGALRADANLVRARFVMHKRHVVEIQGLGSTAEDVATLLDAASLDALAAALAPAR